MPEYNFHTYGDSQAIVRVDYVGLNEELIPTDKNEELIVTVNNEESKILLSIQENEEDKANFELPIDKVKQLFEWLKSKGVIS